MPEDIPLLIAGALCYHGEADLWLMIPLTFVAVITADCILWGLGRRYGHHVPKLPLLRRYLTEARLLKAEGFYQRHGGKTLFIARFLPGLRTPLYFTAGVFRIPFWKLVIYDGSAALISVPTFVLLGYFGASQLERIHHIANEVKIVVAVVVAAAIVAVVAWRLLRRRRIAPAG
jgi:membrane protein DedA with SNARE-associated domain